ncbi:hypothetical protein I4U23_011494 [Adineta vaga]|nr:hypothetical protein I4U23_011494 [Adineta vaga]
MKMHEGVGEENDYDDDDDTINDPAVVRKQQKCKTWLYIVLLGACLYILFYGTLIKTESETLIIYDITPDIFDQLYAEHGQALSCPCSTIIIQYKNFISHNITMHPVCSSIFISKEWIEGLYFGNESLYSVWDFRKSAYGQFQLLSRLCSLSQEIRSQIQNDVDNTELITINLLSRMQIQLEMDNTIESQKNNIFRRMISFLNIWRTTIERNYLVSAFGTNWMVSTLFNDYDPTPVGYQTQYYDNNSLEIQCGQTSGVIVAVLPLPSNDSSDFVPSFTQMPTSNVTDVKGFFLTCTPLDALLESTLDCLYEFECLQLLFKYFPNLTQINFNWNTSILSSKNDNKSVLDYFQKLFIENWLSNLNYSIYFHQCSPSICTYTIINRRNFSYAIALLISLYGGLVIVLRLMASNLINIFFKCTHHSNHTNENSNQQIACTFKLIKSIKQINLFKDIHNRTDRSIKQQRIITRVYFILLIGSTSVLCLFTSLDSQIVTKTVPNPSLTTYNSLETRYSTTLQCPCANKTILYRTLISFSPIFHQICSSGFVQDDWITIMINSMTNMNLFDWRSKAYQQFQILSDFCQLANKTVQTGMDQFLSQFFIASFAINEMNFNKQFNANLNQFYQSTAYNFDLMKDIIQLVQQVNQFYEGIVKMMRNNPDPVLPISILDTQINNYSIAQVNFIFYDIEDINTGLITCICAVNPYCQRQAFISDSDSIYDWNFMSGNEYNHNLTGWIEGCLARNSILFSTLQCLYSESNCFPFLLSYIIKTNTDKLSLQSSSSRLQPLVYNSTINRFPPNTTIAMIVKELMIEKWNPVLSYKQFYKSCSPIYCSYSETVRKQNTLGVMIILISMIGGIIVSLRILTPRLIKFIFTFLTIFKKESNQTQQSNSVVLVQRTCLNRVTIMIQNQMKFVRNTLTELNLFSTRDLGSNVDRITAKYYGQWSTRLYIILFLSCITILIFYTIIQPQQLRKNFNQPSFIDYKQLRTIYGDQLKCSCSRIASTYQQFVNIQPIFHSICSSQFVSDEWRNNITNGLVSNLSIYEQRDYRRFLSAHLQYLQGLCRLSIQTVNNSINEFLRSLLITNELLSENNFENRLNISIEQRKFNAPIFFSNLLFFIQSMIHGNAFISTYETNFVYIYIMDGTDRLTTPTKPVIYDDECSCGLSPNCTTQATFIETNSSENIIVKGMKIGCTTSESLIASTLECFYDQICLDFIQQYTNYENSLIPLSTTLSRFPQNTTIDELRQNLFLEQWSIERNYSSYYEQCLPSICFYTYIERFNILYIITLIFGLQGGLTIVLKWICPKLVRIVLKIYHSRKNRITSIHPVVSIEVRFNTNLNRSIDVIPRINRSIFKIIFALILLLCFLMGVITFSIYYTRQGSTMNIPIGNDLSTIISTTITSNTSESSCQLKVKQLSINTTCSNSISGPYLVADLNNDKRVDLIFSCDDGTIINILYANSNGSFDETIPVLFNLPFLTYMLRILIGDTNNDGQVDLIVLCSIGSSAGKNLHVVDGEGGGRKGFLTSCTYDVL